ncbi:MAG: hypothetical protein E5W35_02440 [Mesorhizobium sp.]|nr:MAG: hypothetical protein E5W35_02440 [Mesorhizobium sp.]TIW84084.1 MAG: hypothetical protein E5V53_01585 [Mesorhizobium sp.]
MALPGTRPGRPAMIRQANQRDRLGVEFSPRDKNLYALAADTKVLVPWGRTIRKIVEAVVAC